MARLTTTVAHRWCRRIHEEEEGVSLIEILIASFILVVAVLSIASAAGASLRGVRVSRDRDAAATAASAGLEAARDLGFGRLALSSSNDFSVDPNVVAGKFSHDGSASEALVLSNNGALPYHCTPSTTTCWFAFQEYGKLDSATLYVTAFDDPSVDGNGDGNLTNDIDGKRATVDVTWTDAGTVRTMRQSTIIAESKRGLGLPEYQVSPITAEGLVKPNDVICFEHTVFNAGAQDSYDLTFETPDGAAQPPTHHSDRILVNTKPGTSGNHQWTARAWFGPNAASDRQAWVDDWRPDGTAVEFDGSRMVNVDGDPRLETQQALPRDETYELHVCYTHGSQVATDEPTVILEPVLRSQLGLVVGDDDTTTLAHTMRVGTAISGLYLSPAATTIGSLQTTAPADTSLADYDGTDGVPGLTLRKPANNGGIPGRYVWAKPHDLDGSVTFTNARLHLWTSWSDAIQFGSATKMRMSFDIRLCIVPTTSDSCGAAGTAIPISYEHASAGWCQHGSSIDCPTSITWSFTDSQSVDSGEHLLIDIACTSPDSGGSKGDDCHFAYGTATFPARLELT